METKRRKRRRKRRRKIKEVLRQEGEEEDQGGLNGSSVPVTKRRREKPQKAIGVGGEDKREIFEVGEDKK